MNLFATETAKVAGLHIYFLAFQYNDVAAYESIRNAALTD
jgi:hypothetical protein